jgi:hypothetical protein
MDARRLRAGRKVQAKRLAAAAPANADARATMGRLSWGGFEGLVSTVSIVALSA